MFWDVAHCRLVVITDVLGQPIGPTFKDQAIQEELMYSMVIRLIQHHKCSDIYLFVIHATCYGQQFQPPSSNITKTWTLKTDKTKEENSHFTVLFKLALIIFTSRNNKVLKHCSVSVGKNCE